MTLFDADVEMCDRQDAEDAVKELNGVTVRGCKLKVEFARDRKGIALFVVCTS